MSFVDRKLRVGRGAGRRDGLAAPDLGVAVKCVDVRRGLLDQARSRLEPLLDEAVLAGDAETIAEVAVDCSEVLRLGGDLARALAVLPLAEATQGQEARARIAVARARIALSRGQVTPEQALPELLPAMRVG